MANFGAVIGAFIGFCVFGPIFLIGAGLGECSPTIYRMFGLCGGLGGAALGALILGSLGSMIDRARGKRSEFLRKVAPGVLGVVIGFGTALAVLHATYPAMQEVLGSLESPLRSFWELMGFQKRPHDTGMLGEMMVLVLSSFACGFLGWRVGRLMVRQRNGQIQDNRA